MPRSPRAGCTGARIATVADRLLQGLAYRLVRDGVDHLHPHAFIGQQAQRPARTARRWRAARQGDRMRFLLAVQLPHVLPARRAPVEGRVQAFRHELLAHARHRRRMATECPGDCGIAPRRPTLALVGVQQDPRGRQSPRRGHPAPHQRPQLCSLLVRQSDRVLGLSHRSLPFAHVVWPPPPTVRG